MKRILMLAAVLAAAMYFAPAASAGEGRHIAGGFIAQPRGDYKGGWGEFGFDVKKRFQVFTAYSRYAEFFQDVAPGARLRLYDHVWVEASYGVGRYESKSTRSYKAGLLLETPAFKKHVAAVAGFDFVAEKVRDLGKFNTFQPRFGLKITF